MNLVSVVMGEIFDTVNIIELRILIRKKLEFQSEKKQILFTFFHKLRNAKRHRV